VTKPEIPDGVSVETVYAVEISYSPEAQVRRPAVRFEHLTRVARMFREGTLVEAGGYLDWKSAILIFRVGSAQEAKDNADSKLVQNLMFYAGIGIYFPMKFTYKTPG